MMNALGIVITIFTFFLAVAGTVLSFIFITPEKRKLPGFFAFLRELFNFKFLVIEMVMKALYIFSTIYSVLYGFFLLFTGFRTVDVWYDESYTVYFGWVGIFIMILAPIVIRLVYEGIMLAILLVKNVIEINKKVPNKNDDSANAAPQAPIFAAPQAPVYAPAQAPVYAPAQAPQAFCTNCGNKLDESGKCPVCGK